jgi:hypothetical protein
MPRTQLPRRSSLPNGLSRIMPLKYAHVAKAPCHALDRAAKPFRTPIVQLSL